MIQQAFLPIAALFLLLSPEKAVSESRQAALVGAGANGKCTIELIVDGAAELDVFGDTGNLRTTSGQTAEWRRFQCNAPLPRNPVDFRFAGFAGRGQAMLVRDPRNNAGVATIRINDPKGGRGAYAFDLMWRAGGGPPAGPPPLPGPGRGQGGYPMHTAILTCQDRVGGKLNRDGYRYVTFEHTVPDNRPGANGWVNGSVTGRRGSQYARFGFSCSADFRTGLVRSVDVRRIDQ